MAFYNAEITVQDTRTTTDATPITIITASMPANTSATIFLEIVARNPANGDTKCWGRMVPLKRTGTAAVAILGAQGDMLPTAADSGASAWALSLTTVGDSLSMQVAGAAGTTVDWYARANGIVVG